MVTLSVALAALAALLPTFNLRQLRHPIMLGALVLLMFAVFDLGLRPTGKSPFSFMELRISPYKSLSYALQYPGANVIYRQWNAFSRLDEIGRASCRERV